MYSLDHSTQLPAAAYSGFQLKGAWKAEGDEVRGSKRREQG